MAGEFPGAQSQIEADHKLIKLIDCGIQHIICLMQPDETDHSGNPFNEYEDSVLRLAEKKKVTVSCFRFPIADQNVPGESEMKVILDAITISIENRKPVYVHCWGGIGRTGTVVGCFLLKNGLATSGDVLQTIADLRKDDPKKHRISPETDAQRKYVKSWLDRDNGQPTNLSRTIGCMLGGAVGDALGAPVEFMKREDILRRFGPDGITSYAPAYGGLGTITDDTQMTLFTAEGLIRGDVRGRHKGITTYTGMTENAYQRWLYTQGERSAKYIDISGEGAGWLIQQQALHNRRAPGNTCISALKEMSKTDKPARNNSKGCGGVMRMAPAGLFHWRLKNYHSPQETFQLGKELAALTHGHPTGALTGGVLAILILALADGATLPDALSLAKTLLRQERQHEETLLAIQLAEEYSKADMPHEVAISKIGLGWIAEEALAISIYCALVARDFRDGIILAVNHDGDSDSTGSITGDLLGTVYGANAIPHEWLEPLELRAVITELAQDLYVFRNWNIGEYSNNEELNKYIWEKYPGY
jgi:ADP-ribosylglycohydrolase/protein-tyrosine phosphatase